MDGIHSKVRETTEAIITAGNQKMLNHGMEINNADTLIKSKKTLLLLSF
jgi:hypothetical protein